VITVERILMLREVPLFARMPADELARIASISQSVVYSGGERIFAEGDFGDRLYVIVEGDVSITLRGRVVSTLRQREYFGEMSLLDGEPRSATATAATDCLLLEIRQRDFHEILAHHYEASLAVIKTLSHRLRVELARGAAAQQAAETGS